MECHSQMKRASWPPLSLVNHDVVVEVEELDYLRHYDSVRLTASYFSAQGHAECFLEG